MKNLSKTVRFSKVIYCFLFLIIASMGALSFYTISNSSNKFTDYREMAIDSNISKNLLNELMLLRLTVKNFIQYQDESVAEKFYKKLAKVEEAIADAEVNIQHPKRASLLKQTKSQFQSYKNKFSELEELVRTRKVKMGKKEVANKAVLESLRSSSSSGVYLSWYLDGYTDLEKSLADQGKL